MAHAASMRFMDDPMGILRYIYVFLYKDIVSGRLYVVLIGMLCYACRHLTAATAAAAAAASPSLPAAMTLRILIQKVRMIR